MALTLREQGSLGGEQAQALGDEGLDFVVQVWTVDGRSVFASRRHEALPSRAVIGFADVKVVGGDTWRTFSVVTPSLVIQVAQPLQIRERLAASAAWRSVIPLLLLAPVLGIAMWWLVNRSLAPLRRVADDVRSRDAGALSAVRDDGLPDEVEPLVQSINALLARVAESFEAQRAFVADAAHELRSPLTALKLQLQVLRRAPDGAARSTAVDALDEGVLRASRLVDQLLSLARSESAGSAPAAAQSLTVVDLAEVARQALADTVPFALSRRSELQLDVAGPSSVVADAAALSVLVRNLADNAVRYSPEGSVIHVSVGQGAGAATGPDGGVRLDAGGEVLLVVDDAGPGIPVGERERVLDRFYRRDETSSEASGTGLGLAIVRSIAARHGASLTLGDSPMGGLRVTVRFAGSAAAAA
jgi:two-component system OmpR family sensor kinase/two-component system sensor histidine kinase QseC